jgi:hypothetical protein
MTSHLTHFIRIALGAVALCASASAQTTMYIESCSLGCSSGSGGSQVSCVLTSHSPDADVRVRFSRPVDPASISWASFQIINVNNGTVPPGTRFVDPNDDHALVFRPAIAFDAFGNPVFGFDANSIYRITVPGEAQGDFPPLITSTDVPGLPNQSRMQCDVITLPSPTPAGVTYCFGTTSCPCANPGLAGRGCANSASASGLGLESGGVASVSGDSLRIWLRGLPTGLVQYFQGTLRENGGAGTPFGDGLLCVGGDLIRLRSQSAGGGSTFVIPLGARTISLQGQIPPSGATRTYQAFYRDNASFCTSATFNWTNAIEIAWTP